MESNLKLQERHELKYSRTDFYILKPVSLLHLIPVCRLKGLDLIFNKVDTVVKKVKRCIKKKKKNVLLVEYDGFVVAYQYAFFIKRGEEKT